MNEVETGKLLTFISGLDNRKLSKETILAWHQLLGDVHFEDALEAARQHYRDSRDWLMPADLVQGAKRIGSQNRRWATVKQWELEASYEDDFDPVEWMRKLSRRDDVSQYVRERAAIEYERRRGSHEQIEQP